jgi:transposase
MAHDGVIATEMHTGSIDDEVFADFVRGSLILQMQSFDGDADKSVAVMDNCSIHHTETITHLLQEAGIVVIFLPPYSPDFKPIEFTFSYVKSYLRQHELLLAISDPTPVISAAFESITSQHCKSWISSCGYI